MKTIINHLQGNGNLVNPTQTAKILGISVDTLAVWRCTKRYPLSYIKVGRSIRYKLDDIEKFIESRTVES